MPKRSLTTDRSSERSFEPNSDFERRDELLGLRRWSYPAGCEPFGDLCAAQFRALLDERFIDPDRRCRDSPSAGDLAEFMERWPNVLAHGSVIGVSAATSWIAIEGIECDTTQIPTLAREAFYEEFSWFCGDATDYVEDTDYVYAHWR